MNKLTELQSKVSKQASVLGKFQTILCAIAYPQRGTDEDTASLEDYACLIQDNFDQPTLDENFDPTPYCSICGDKTATRCNCHSFDPMN